MHLLPDIKLVNINHKGSRRKAAFRVFNERFKERGGKNLFFSFFTMGIHPYRLYRKSKRRVALALASRKLFYFKSLQSQIEKIRFEQFHLDPRQNLHAIFMKVQTEKVSKEEGALEFKKIYYPYEILLFITNPVRDQKSLRFYRLKSRHSDSLDTWNELKRKARINQYRQIQNINFCITMLRREYKLTPSGIHNRLSRTALYKKNPSELTKFKELSRSLQEILIAYQDFEDLKESKPALFHLLKNLAAISSKEIEIFQSYLKNVDLPHDLPLDSRKQLLQLGNNQEVLYRLSEEEQFELCALILEGHQWDFLLSIQAVSSVTLNLLDWAFEEAKSSIHPTASFVDKMNFIESKKVVKHPDLFPSLIEKIGEKRGLLEEMIVSFAKEIHREWPSLALFKQKESFYESKKKDSLTTEELIEIYEALEKFCGGDLSLLILLQKALSQEGKNGFQLAIEEGVQHLLGEKLEVFLPIFSNFSVVVVRKSEADIEIHYFFKQLVMKNGNIYASNGKNKSMVIIQPLIKTEEKWQSPECLVNMEKG